MMSRAVHAAARGGSVEMLRELLEEGPSSVSTYLDIRGSTVLHAASGRGQLQVSQPHLLLLALHLLQFAFLAILVESLDPFLRE
jgi:ankyrin repeat protein